MVHRQRDARQVELKSNDELTGRKWEKSYMFILLPLNWNIKQLGLFLRLCPKWWLSQNMVWDLDSMAVLNFLDPGSYEDGDLEKWNAYIAWWGVRCRVCSIFLAFKALRWSVYIANRCSSPSSHWWHFYNVFFIMPALQIILLYYQSCNFFWEL